MIKWLKEEKSTNYIQFVSYRSQLRVEKFNLKKKKFE